jgi:hypothetical protein
VAVAHATGSPELAVQEYIASALAARRGDARGDSADDASRSSLAAQQHVRVRRRHALHRAASELADAAIQAVCASVPSDRAASLRTWLTFDATPEQLQALVDGGARAGRAAGGASSSAAAGRAAPRAYPVDSVRQAQLVLAAFEAFLAQAEGGRPDRPNPQSALLPRHMRPRSHRRPAALAVRATAGAAVGGDGSPVEEEEGGGRVSVYSDRSAALLSMRVSVLGLPAMRDLHEDATLRLVVRDTALAVGLRRAGDRDEVEGAGEEGEAAEEGARPPSAALAAARDNRGDPAQWLTVALGLHEHATARGLRLSHATYAALLAACGRRMSPRAMAPLYAHMRAGGVLPLGGQNGGPRRW